MRNSSNLDSHNSPVIGAISRVYVSKFNQYLNPMHNELGLTKLCITDI